MSEFLKNVLNECGATEEELSVFQYFLSAFDPLKIEEFDELVWRRALTELLRIHHSNNDQLRKCHTELSQCHNELSQCRNDLMHRRILVGITSIKQQLMSDPDFVVKLVKMYTLLPLKPPFCLLTSEVSAQSSGVNTRVTSPSISREGGGKRKLITTETETSNIDSSSSNVQGIGELNATKKLRVDSPSLNLEVPLSSPPSRNAIPMNSGKKKKSSQPPTPNNQTITERLPTMSTFDFAKLNIISKHLASELNVSQVANNDAIDHSPENVWGLPTIEEMKEFLVSLDPNVIKLVNSEAIYLDYLREMLNFYKVEMKIETIDEESISQPIICNFFERLIKLFPSILSTSSIVNINGIMLNAWFPTGNGEDKSITGKGDARLTTAQTAFMVEIKAIFLKMKRPNIAQAFLQAYAELTTKLNNGNARGNARKVTPSVGGAVGTSASTAIVNEDQQHDMEPILQQHPDEHEPNRHLPPQPQTIGILTNLLTLVEVCFTRDNGKFYFKYTTDIEHVDNRNTNPLPAQEYIIRLLYLLAKSPNELSDQSLALYTAAVPVEREGTGGNIRADKENDATQQLSTSHEQFGPIEGSVPSDSVVEDVMTIIGHTIKVENNWEVSCRMNGQYTGEDINDGVSYQSTDDNNNDDAEVEDYDYDEAEAYSEYADDGCEGDEAIASDVSLELDTTTIPMDTEIHQEPVIVTEDGKESPLPTKLFDNHDILDDSSPRNLINDN